MHAALEETVVDALETPAQVEVLIREEEPSESLHPRSRELVLELLLEVSFDPALASLLSSSPGPVEESPLLLDDELEEGLLRLELWTLSWLDVHISCEEELRLRVHDDGEDLALVRPAEIVVISMPDYVVSRRQEADELIVIVQARMELFGWHNAVPEGVPLSPRWDLADQDSCLAHFRIALVDDEAMIEVRQLVQSSRLQVPLP